MTQHQKILQLHENREWVCQAEYRNISWCPHKRRTDICEGRAKDLEGNKIPAGTYYFDWKECGHEIKGSRDYLLVNRVKPLEAKYLQVGRTIECGACHPEKFASCKKLEETYKDYGWKCECICHEIPEFIHE